MAGAGAGREKEVDSLMVPGEETREHSSEELAYSAGERFLLIGKGQR